ncbi:hypothetical protein B0T10DRAFT_573684 [Thelonectria olida]|uniref:EthD domain-containing protein n=1 Tax=Thelonectria olida TaxID=1576542 RepID=A0A9P9AH14_9HYPO|nr:hypothetical protein B0T10DRAFT_573684 [Thelonectria olida]
MANEPTYSMLLYFKKNPKITHEEFKDYYENVHAPRIMEITQSAKGLIAYTRQYINHDHSDAATSNPFVAFGSPVPEIPFDIVNAVTFQTKADAVEFSRMMYEDEENSVKILKDENYLFVRSQSRGVVVDKSVSIG